MRNEATLNAICTELQRNCGDDLAACKAVGVSLLFLNQWRSDDKEVDQQILESARVGVQGLVSAAIQRGVHGVQEDVYYKGSIVGEKTVYSDSLLSTLLKAKVPEFSKDSENGGVHVNVNVANLMPRAETYDQWLEMRRQTLASPDIALAAPLGAIEAEYEEVPNALSRIAL